MSIPAAEHHCLDPDAYFLANAEKVIAGSRLSAARDHIQHGNTSVFSHSVAVAYYSYRAALRLGFNSRKDELIRGALLHDYFLYDWHEMDSSHRLHGFYHPGKALANAGQDFALSYIEQDIIRKHMFPLTLYPPRYRESILVCFVDKLCSLYEIFSRNPYRTMRRRVALADLPPAEESAA